MSVNIPSTFGGSIIKGKRSNTSEISGLFLATGYKCDMKTYLTHPWQFTMEGTEDPVYAEHSRDKRKYFEVLRYLYDQLKNGKISSDEFKSKVQGEDSVDVRIVESSSLTEMTVS